MNSRSSPRGQQTDNSQQWRQHQFIPGSEADPFYGFNAEPSGSYYDSTHHTRIEFPTPVLDPDSYIDSDVDDSSVEISVSGLAF